ncbi:hypothetical protein N9B72_00920 [Bacteriovoracaceae bacterium]|nr:hypothetical protein [Bacteriovoracaceae bacterium]
MIKLLLLCILISSCTYLIPKKNLGGAVNLQMITKQDNYCKSKTSFELIDNGPYTQKVFKIFLKKVKAQEKLSSTDEFILWSFFQMNTRPDLSSPSSKFVSLYKDEGVTKYLEVSSTDNKATTYPYLMGLHILNKELKNKRSLLRLALIFDRYAPNYFKINHEFADFLQKNAQTILKDKYTKKVFSRGGEILKEGETIPKLLLSKILLRLKPYLKDANYKVKRTLFKYQATPLLEVQCNYDFKLYNSSIYLINEELIKSNFYGYKSNGSSFFVSSLLQSDKLELIEKTFLVKGKSKMQSPAVCFYNNKKKNIWLFSDNSRDPGQHLFHLMKYGLDQVQSTSQLNEFLSFSRHLILRSPLRLIFESKRGSKSQLDQLLKLSIPTYNANNLGNIWLYYNTPKNDGHFFYDPRNKGQLTCQP